MRAGQSLIFLSGLHRSGTTLMAQLLARSPAVSGLANTGVPYDEGQFLQRVYPLDRRFGGPGRFGFAPAAHMTESAVRDAEKERAGLLAAWTPYWDLSREFLLEKTPSNLLRTRYLQALFPSAHFIILIRQPVAVAMATRKWSQTSTFSLVCHWLRCHDLVEDDLRFLSRAIVLRYEAWMRHPDQTASLITDFLGIDAIDAGDLVDPAIDRAYFRSWRDHLDGAGLTVVRPGKMRGRIEAALGRVTDRLRLDTLRRENEYACCVQRFEDDIGRFGYSLIDPDRPPAAGHRLPHGLRGREGDLLEPEPSA